MSQELTVRCDGCGGDLTSTGNSIDWRLSLKPEKIPVTPGAVTDMWIEPAIKGDRHFCGLPCLADWIEQGPGRT